MQDDHSPTAQASTSTLAPKHPPLVPVRAGQNIKPQRVQGTTCRDQCPLKPSAFETASTQKDTFGRPAVLLKVYKSNEAGSQRPIIKEGQPIEGSVELYFSKAEYVEEISVSVSSIYVFQSIMPMLLKVRGLITGQTRHSKRFIEIDQVLHAAESAAQNIGSSSRCRSPSAQLRGHFNWPFSIRLPSHLFATDGSESSDNRPFGHLPPSFSVSGLRTSINYELSVTVKMRHTLS